jgi:hypothetical protein
MSCVDFGIAGFGWIGATTPKRTGRDLSRASVEAATIAHVSNSKALPSRMNPPATSFRSLGA